MCNQNGPTLTNKMHTNDTMTSKMLTKHSRQTT